MADQNKDKKAKAKFTPVSESAEQKKDSGAPGGGAGRVEDVSGSGVYPASGPLPPGNAPYQAEGSFGQGERGPAGYEDSGDSELLTSDGQSDLGGQPEATKEQKGSSSQEEDAHERRAEARKASQ